MSEPITRPNLAVAPDLELDRHVAALESAWFQNGMAEIDDFLPAFADHPRYFDILAELIRVDLELAWEHGQERFLEHYRERYPEPFLNPHRLRSFALEERRIRCSHGEKPAVEEYRRRFGLDLGSTAIVPCQAIEPPTESEEPNRMPKLGETVCGFKLEAELGQGAFGEVFLASQTDLADRWVALKISSRFPGEASVLARLQHSNIVPIYSMHHHGRLHVVCMPFLGASTLTDWLREYRAAGPNPPSGLTIASTLCDAAARTVPNSGSVEITATDPTTRFLPSVATMYAKRSYTELVLWMGAELADGLAHAHERGILHRDLKPANVLLTDEGRPMLLDFNLAAASIEEADTETAIGGTPRYMAPEQLAAMFGAASSVDARSDIYSLGLLLCELLTGDIPFPKRSGRGLDLIAQMLLDRSAGAPEIRHPRLTPAVASILRTALEPNPDRRYPSAGALREDLRRQLDHRPLMFARDPSWRERLGKWSRRHPRLSSSSLLGTLAVAAILLIVGGFLVRQRHLNRLEAEQHLASVNATRSEVAALLADGRGPRAEVQLASRRTAEVLESVERVDATHLSMDRQRELRTGIGELLYYQARARWILARQAPTQDRDHASNAAWEAHELAWASSTEPRPAMLVAQRVGLLRERGLKAEALRVAQELAPEIADLDSRSAARFRLKALAGSSRTQAANASHWLTVGRLHATVGERLLARGCFKLATELDDESPWPHYHDGLTCLELKDYSAAESAFDRVLLRDATIAEVYFNRAIARIERGNFAGAVIDLNRIEEEAARLPRLYFIREHARRAIGDTSGANRDRDIGLKLTPVDPASWNARGEARLRLSPPDTAGGLADYRQAVELDPEFRQGYENQAQVLSEHLGKTAEAVEYLDRAVERFPDYAPARSSRAVLLARLGRREAARRDADAALKLDPAPLHCYQAACVFLLTANGPADRDRAMELLRRALRADPSWANYMPTDADLKALSQSKEFIVLLRAAQELLK